MHDPFYGNGSIQVCDEFIDTGRGCKALVDIDDGQPIVDVPYHRMITATGRAYPDVNRINRLMWQQGIFNVPTMDQDELLELEWIVCWFAFLRFSLESKPALHLEHLKDSLQTTIFCSWKSYYQLLPHSFDTMACYLDPCLLNILPQDISCHVSTQSQQRSINVKNIQRYFESILSREQLEWAWNLVNTRCISLLSCPTYKHIFDKRQHLDKMAVIPLLDCLNHNSHARCRMQFIVSSPLEYHSFQLFVDGRVSKNDQVFIHYGHHDNHFLLVEYGFIEKDNPFNVVYLDQMAFLAMKKEMAQDWNKIQHQLNMRSLLGDYAIVSDACNQEPVLRLWNALRFCVQYQTAIKTSADLETSLKEWEAVFYGQKEYLSFENEISSLTLYLEIVNLQLKSNQESKLKLQNLSADRIQRQMVFEILAEDESLLDRHRICVETLIAQLTDDKGLR